MTRIREEEEE